MEASSISFIQKKKRPASHLYVIGGEKKQFFYNTLFKGFNYLKCFHVSMNGGNSEE